jgi:hypothetical protein
MSADACWEDLLMAALFAAVLVGIAAGWLP